MKVPTMPRVPILMGSSSAEAIYMTSPEVTSIQFVGIEDLVAKILPLFDIPPPPSIKHGMLPSKVIEVLEDTTHTGLAKVTPFFWCNPTKEEETIKPLPNTEASEGTLNDLGYQYIDIEGDPAFM